MRQKDLFCRVFRGVFVMKVVTTRDIKTNPALLYGTGEAKVLMVRNRPRALCFSLQEDEDPVALLDAFQRMRATMALETMRRLSRARGVSDLTDEEIDDEITAYRRR